MSELYDVEVTPLLQNVGEYIGTWGAGGHTGGLDAVSHRPDQTLLDGGGIRRLCARIPRSPWQTCCQLSCRPTKPSDDPATMSPGLSRQEPFEKPHHSLTFSAGESLVKKFLKITGLILLGIVALVLLVYGGIYAWSFAMPEVAPVAIVSAPDPATSYDDAIARFDAYLAEEEARGDIDPKCLPFLLTHGQKTGPRHRALPRADRLPFPISRVRPVALRRGLQRLRAASAAPRLRRPHGQCPG